MGESSESFAGAEGERRLSARSAHVFAWLGVALVNALNIALSPWPYTGATTRLLHHAFDLGHAVAIAFGGYALARLWRRAVPPSRGLAFAGFSLLAAGASPLLLAGDFANWAERHESEWLMWPAAAGASLAVPAAFWAGQWLARPAWRWLAVVASAAAAALNHHVLENDYPGIHLYFLWGAATFATGALAGARLSARLPREEPRAARSAGALFAAFSVATLVVWPPAAVVTEAFKTEGSVLFPFLAGLHGKDTVMLSAEAAGRHVHPEWLEPRGTVPAIPPSEPSLLPKTPVIIFLTIDALRAELLGATALRGRLPNLARFADESVEFTNARTPGSTTRNSLGSAFASKYSSQLEWTKVGRGRTLSRDPTPRLGDRLQAAGFFTVYLAPYGPIAGKSGVLGKFRREVRLRPTRAGQRFPLSEETVDAALEKIERLRERKLFVYMHWMDPHEPYDAAGDGGSEFERYVREVELCDRSFGRLWKSLEELDLLDRTVLVLSADHGEALGEHGIPHHGGSLYEVLLRVPLVIRVPGVEPRRVAAPVALIDIAPTLLDLVGAATPGQYMGQSLVPFLRGEAARLTRPIAADQVSVKAMLFRRFKVIDNRRRNTVELFDLETDPNEKRNLYGEVPERDTALLGALRNFFAVHERGDVEADDGDE
ncbi:MAG TPA: sulfatase [Polyangiaceae bacterium]